jgi:hypothetical protein
LFLSMIILAVWELNRAFLMTYGKLVEVFIDSVLALNASSCYRLSSLFSDSVAFTMEMGEPLRKSTSKNFVG